LIISFKTIIVQHKKKQ